MVQHTITCAVVLGLLVGFAYPRTLNAHEGTEEKEEKEVDALFMTALDMGVLWNANPELGEGFMVRTAADYRFRSIEGPFLRLNIDSTTARYKQEPGDDRPGFSATMSLNDILLGGGYRLGEGDLQIALAIQGGVVIYGLPKLEGDEVLTVNTTTEVAGAARASAALEYYIEPDAALTVELINQYYWGQEVWSNTDAWSLGLVFGITTTL
ncbi:MAG: hypothetical protein AAFX99_02810 [Myxococcota bacterium]